jgi:hypothetical protein
MLSLENNLLRLFVVRVMFRFWRDVLTVHGVTGRFAGTTLGMTSTSNAPTPPPVCSEGDVQVLERCPDGSWSHRQVCRNNAWHDEYQQCPTPQSQKKSLGLWLEENYSSDSVGSSYIQQLESDVDSHHAKYLFLFFASIDSAGELQTDEGPLTGAFLRELHGHGVKVIAVLDGWGPNTSKGSDPKWRLDLSNPSVRHSIALGSAHLVSVGFDGVQLDIEGVQCGTWPWETCQSQDFVTLLSGIRQEIDDAAQGSGAYLSVALPAKSGSLCDGLSSFSRWADYTAIAQYADSIVPMAYDSNQGTWACAGQFTYGGWVNSVANYAVRQAAGERATVLIGLPAGRANEPLDQALKALGAVDSPGFEGIAVYVYSHSPEPILSENWQSIDDFLKS